MAAEVAGQIQLELDRQQVDGGAHTAAVPVAWCDSDAQVEKRRIARTDSVLDIGLQLIRGTLERMSNKQTKKSPQSQRAIRPTPVQLALWPHLLGSSGQNALGFASTGSGKVSESSANFIDHED